MPDLLQQGAELLARVAASHTSQPVTYHRDAQGLAVNATVGATDFEEIDSEGRITERRGRDFIVAAADLDFGAGPVDPRAGDQIRQTDKSGTVHVYEVSSPGGRPPWQWHDRYHQRRRIHTRYVKSIAP